MKIRTRLTLCISLLVLAVLISIAAVAWSVARVQDAMEQTTVAASAGRRVLELTQLTAELEFRQEARPLAQWIQVQQALTEAIERLAMLPMRSHDPALHDRLRHNNKNARQLLDRWAAEDGSKLTRLLSDSIMIRLRAMEAVTQRLVQDSRLAVSRQMTQLIVVLALCLCLIGGSGVLIALVNRRMIRSLDRLGQAIGTIAEGGERIAVRLPGEDEFSRLGATLTDMSTRLADAREALTEANGRMAAEVATRRMAELQLRLAIDSMESAFAYFDADDRLVVCNDRFIDPGTRKNIGNPVGRSFEEILRAFAQDSFTAVEALADREAWFRWRLDQHRNPRGKALEMQWTDGTWSAVSERRTSDGSIVSLWTDITEQKQRQAELEYSQDQFARQASELVELAENLELAKREAERANREKSRFLASMSHELRTPLNAINGFAEIMRNELFGPIQPARYAEYVGIIGDSGAHLLSLINDVLDLSKVEAGRMTLSVEILSPIEVCHQAVGLTREMAMQKGVRLSHRLDDACQAVHGDQRAVKQILLNLLSNAIKFTDAGGSVHLDVGVTDEGAVLRVTDTGIGMTEAELRKALEPYGQIESTVARKSVGTGLGLPLAKGLAELHGGRLSLTSKQGDGTSVTVLLPWKPELFHVPVHARASS